MILNQEATLPLIQLRLDQEVMTAARKSHSSPADRANQLQHWMGDQASDGDENHHIKNICIGDSHCRILNIKIM